MTELKCPYCNKQLQHALSIDRHDFYWCPNYDCDSSSEMVGTEEMWATIIDTKKKLDIALKELKASDKYYQDDDCIKEAIKKIEQINKKEEK